MCSDFVGAMGMKGGILVRIRSIGISVGQPQVAQDHQHGVRRPRVSEMAVQPCGDLQPGRFAEDELAVEEMAVHWKVPMDADPGGIGAFVEHLEMGEGAYAGGGDGW